MKFKTPIYVTGFLCVALVACGTPITPAVDPVVTVLTTPRPIQKPLDVIVPTVAPSTAMPTAPAVVRTIAATETPMINAASASKSVRAAVSSEIPSSIEIAGIDLNAPIRKVGLVPAKGGGVEWGLPSGKVVGWHDDSAKLGEIGNVVLSGHHNIDGLVFQRLNELPGNASQVCAADLRSTAKGIKQGQKIVLRSAHHEVTFELTDCKLLLQRGMPVQTLLEHGQLMLQDGQDKLTIVTCWPFTDNSHRLVLIAKPVSSRII